MARFGKPVGRSIRIRGHVARYGKDQKQVTRQRIIDVAGRRFKQDGIGGSGIATLMADAGLTNGAFYAHFDSKDHLVAATIAEQLRSQGRDFESLAAEPDGLEKIVRIYLSTEHRDNPDHGCPSAALLDELGRSGADTRQAYTEGLLAVVDAIAGQLAPHDPQSARVTILIAFAMMAGTLQISRALTDHALADQVLEQGIGVALGLFAASADQPTDGPSVGPASSAGA